MQSAVPVPEGTDPPLADVIPLRPVEPVLEEQAAEPEITVLWTDLGTKLTGGVVTDPAEIAAIRRRVMANAAGRGAWRRRLRMIRRSGR